MKGVDLDDILFTVVYTRNDSDFSGGHDFSKGDTFDGLDDFKYELDSHAESINGYYDVIADGRNGDLIAIQFYGLNPISNEEIEDTYMEIRCSLRESAIPTIGDALVK